MTRLWCPAEILKDYEAKLTAGYSESYSKGTNAGVTVNVKNGEHGTVTAGELGKMRLVLYLNAVTGCRHGILHGTDKLSWAPLLLQCYTALSRACTDHIAPVKC